MINMQSQTVGFGKLVFWLSTISLLVALSGPAAAKVLQSNEPERAEQSSQKTYGPITQKDTMWFIANRIHPDRSVSIYQTMAALVDANPELFPEDNINRLVTGEMLYVPSAEDIRAQDAERARARMIPLLGGEFAAAMAVEEARVDTDELKAEHEAALGDLQQALSDTERALRNANRENAELEARIMDLETALDATESALTAAKSESPANRSVAPSNENQEVVYEPSLAWFMSWPGLVIPLAFIGLIFAFLVVALRKTSVKSEPAASHTMATAAHLAESEKQQEEALTAADTNDTTSASEAANGPTETYREISDILDEAEADADADSDFDAGQTNEEAEQAEREEFAAQIDLARAYLEMGELDEAIAALEEVMPVADSELQAEAEQLLEKIKEQK